MIGLLCMSQECPRRLSGIRKSGTLFAKISRVLPVCRWWEMPAPPEAWQIDRE